MSEIHADADTVLGQKSGLGGTFASASSTQPSWTLSPLSTLSSLPASLVLSLFSPSSTSPTLQYPGCHLFTPRFAASYSHTGDDACLLWHWQNPDCACQWERKPRFLGTWYSAFPALNPKIHPLLLSPLRPSCPILQDAILRGHVLALIL